MSIWYSSLGLLIGSLFLVAGLLCAMHRLAGETRFEATIWGFRVEIKTSVPGVMFALLGVIVIFVTRLV